LASLQNKFDMPACVTSVFVSVEKEMMLQLWSVIFQHACAGGGDVQ